MQRPEWRLSGPHRFAQRVADDLDDGRSSILLVPTASFPEGLQASVRELMPDLEVNRFGLDELIEGRGRVVDVLFQRLDLSRSTDDAIIDVASFAHNPGLRRRLIWVDSRGASERQCDLWIDFLEQYASAAADVPLYRRTVFATFWGGHHASRVPESVPLLARRWWWGVVTPLDTEVFVSELARERPWRPAFTQTVSEVSGFDLELAAMLVEVWDGVPSNLGPLLRDHPIYSSAGAYAWSLKPSPRPQPPADSIAAWSAGLVNAWGERDPHEHPCSACAAKSDALHRLVWLGQVRSLMPRIEIERQTLAEWVYARRDRLPRHWKTKDVRSLEVGPLASIFEMPGFRNDHKRGPLARWLRRTRNAIAHLEILDADELEQGRRLLRQETGSVSPNNEPSPQASRFR
jgi:hypothetical protein